MGVKGPCWLSTLQNFNLVHGMSPDYMHCALIGAAKLLIGLWMDKSRCLRTEHDIHHLIVYIDECLQKIATPSEIPQKPRGLSDLKHWKGIL